MKILSFILCLFLHSQWLFSQNIGVFKYQFTDCIFHMMDRTIRQETTTKEGEIRSLGEYIIYSEAIHESDSIYVDTIPILKSRYDGRGIVTLSLPDNAHMTIQKRMIYYRRKVGKIWVEERFYQKHE